MTTERASSAIQSPRRPRRFGRSDAARLVGRAVIVLFSWFTYGLVRTERAELGFSLGVTLEAMAFTLVPLLVAWSLAVLLTFAREFGTTASHGLSQRWFRWARVLAICLLLGWTTAEVQILADEALFRSQMSATQPTTPTMRTRAWPHAGCQLGYSPEHGFFATD